MISLHTQINDFSFNNVINVLSLYTSHFLFNAQSLSLCDWWSDIYSLVSGELVSLRCFVAAEEPPTLQ